MTTESNSRLISSSQSFSKAASVITVLVGCLVLVGWALDIVALKSVFPGLATMKANTAFCFVLAGAALWLLQADWVGPRTRPIAQACASIVALLGLLTLIEYRFGWDLGIDQILFKDSLGNPPGRMSHGTAMSLIAIGAALLILDLEVGPRKHRPSQYLLLLPALVGLLSLIGYAYGVQSLYSFGPYSSIALHTALLVVVLAVGTLCARPHPGLMAIVASDGPGGMIVRRLFPAAVVIPMVLGWLRLEGQHSGLYGLEFGTAQRLSQETGTVAQAHGAGFALRP